MDANRFDALTRSFGDRPTRRRFAQLLASGALVALGLDRVHQASAQTACIPSKQACQTTEQCCRGACVNNVCDATCSETDAICEQTLDCCSDLSCVVVSGTPRCRPQSCAAQGDQCQNDDDCCAGVCHRQKSSHAHNGSKPGSKPASGGQCRSRR